MRGFSVLSLVRRNTFRNTQTCVVLRRTVHSRSVIRRFGGSFTCITIRCSSSQPSRNGHASHSAVKPEREYLVFQKPNPAHRIYARANRESWKRSVWIERIILALSLAIIVGPLGYAWMNHDGMVPFTHRRRLMFVPLWFDSLMGTYTLSAVLGEVPDSESSSDDQSSSSNKQSSSSPSSSSESDMKLLRSEDDPRVMHLEKVFYSVLFANHLCSEQEYHSKLDHTLKINQQSEQVRRPLTQSELKQLGWLDSDMVRPRDVRRMQLYGQSFDWCMRVIDKGDGIETINAMCAPGGQLLVFTELLERKCVESDEEFASIICHELSHSIARHGVENLQYSLFGVACLYGIMAALGIELSSFMDRILMFVVSRVMMLPMSRSFEHEADEISVHLMVAAGYNPYSLIRVLGKIDRAQQEASVLGNVKPPEWLSTHPLTENRVSELRKKIKELYPHFVESPTK